MWAQGKPDLAILSARSLGGAPMAKTFTRKELYELVWSTPMKTLAASFGLSDVGLAKACRKADIPLPERGYWATPQAV